jgi:hypothetical protein
MKKLLLLLLGGSFVLNAQTSKLPKDFTVIVKPHQVSKTVQCTDTIWSNATTYEINTFFCDSMININPEIFDITFNFRESKISIVDSKGNITYGSIDVYVWATKWNSNKSKFEDDNCIITIIGDLGVWNVDYCEKTFFLQNGLQTTNYKVLDFYKYNK